MGIKTKPGDVIEFLKSDEDIRHYLEAAFEDGDPSLIRGALNDIAKARGMTALARESGVSREAATRSEGRPVRSACRPGQII